MNGLNLTSQTWQGAPYILLAKPLVRKTIMLTLQSGDMFLLKNTFSSM